MKRIAITGAAGYLGQRLIAALVLDPRVELILAIDIRSTAYESPKVRPIVHDVTQSMVNIFIGDKVDTAVHLAYVLDPIHDRQREQAINIGGTRNFFKACAAAEVQTILVASSATVYGAWPEHTEPLTEEAPLRGKPSFTYVDDKLVMEQLAADYQAKHPTSRVLISRVAVAVGPHMSNYLSRYFQRRVVFTVKGANPHIGVVHEDDVARAKVALLKEAPRGAYNICAPQPLTLQEIVAQMGNRMVPLPAGMVYTLARWAWRGKFSALSEAPPIMIDYVRYPWLTDGQKIIRLTNFQYQYDSLAAVAAFANVQS